jgi:hypothetical protein
VLGILAPVSGPRRRPRLAIGTALAGILVVVVTAVLLTRPATHSRRAAASAHKYVPSTLTSYRDGRAYVHPAGISMGMTGDQVRRSVGKPARRQGRCWWYSQPVYKSMAVRGVVKNYLGVCFFGGVVSDLQGRSYDRRGKLVHLPTGPGS